MALNTLKCNHLTLLSSKGLNKSIVSEYNNINGHLQHGINQHDCFWLSVPVQLIAWKDSSRYDLLCVEWDVKPYTLTHSPKQFSV